MINRKRYVNLDGVSTTKSLNDMRKWQKERRAKLSDMSFIVPQSSEKMMGYLRINRNDSTITWVGQTLWIKDDGFTISSDKNYLDVETIFQFLDKESYWSKGISKVRQWGRVNR